MYIVLCLFESRMRYIICVLIIKNLAIWFKPTVSNDYLSVCMIAACAAARRAMGTRNGEQLT